MGIIVLPGPSSDSRLRWSHKEARTSRERSARRSWPRSAMERCERMSVFKDRIDGWSIYVNLTCVWHYDVQVWY